MEKEKSQEELVKIRNSSAISSEEYQRTKDRIRDIQGDVNNIQIGNLTDFIRLYKIETDKNIKSNHNLSLVAIGVAILMPLIPMIIDLITKYCL